MTHPSRPATLIGVCADSKDLDGRPYHVAGDKYLRAVAQLTGAAPLVIPALTEWLDPKRILEQLDGLFLTGSASNVHPRHYGQQASTHHPPYDEARDTLTLALLHECLAQAVPLLAVCRGMQELNVALGGTLHAQLHRLEGRIDHRAPDDAPMDVQYGPSHPVSFVAGGRFEAIANASSIEVNSIHLQGVDRLAPGLVVEGHAPDGTIEAVRVRDAAGFALGVQWHPEYRAHENEFSRRLFRCFGEAARARRSARSA